MGEQTKGIGLGRWQLSLLEIKPCHDSLLGKDNYKDTKNTPRGMKGLGRRK